MENRFRYIRAHIRLLWRGKTIHPLDRAEAAKMYEELGHLNGTDFAVLRTTFEEVSLMHKQLDTLFYLSTPEEAC